MRIPIRPRLSLSFLAVLLIGMGLAAGLTWAAVERLYLKTQEINLIAQAELTAAAIQDTGLPVGPAEPYLQTLNVAPGIHTRLLSQSGAVVVNLPIPGEGVSVQVPIAENAGFVPSEELLQRPEIQASLAGESAAATRRVSAAGGQRVLYAAAPIYQQAAEVAGIVYLATPLPRSGLPMELIAQLGGILIIAAVLASLTGSWLARGIARPIEVLDQAAQAVSEGYLDQAVPTGQGIPELARLSQTFNQMTASLDQANQV
jgi:HAMP domain-containing protein